MEWLPRSRRVVKENLSRRQVRETDHSLNVPRVEVIRGGINVDEHGCAPLRAIAPADDSEDPPTQKAAAGSGATEELRWVQ